MSYGCAEELDDARDRLAALEHERDRMRVALGAIAALDDESTGNIRGTIARRALGGEVRGDEA